MKQLIMNGYVNEKLARKILQKIKKVQSDQNMMAPQMKNSH